ncbi:MAG: hypothetical protein M1358_18320, partial [Chloroflexi bacterium]|nr:hypothetical protein [Chloroflexota bacterium]
AAKLAGSESKVMGASGYWGVYQGSGNFPRGYWGGAIISSSQPLVAIVNQISTDGKAMSYEGVGE